MNKINRYLMLSAAMLVLGGCHEPSKAKSSAASQAALAAPIAPLDEAAKADIKQKFEKITGGDRIKVEGVSTTPIAGLYQLVVTGKQVVYTDRDVNYLVMGQMIDLKNKKNLTDEVMQQSMHVDYQKLPFDKAIKEVRGNGKRQMAVFSDPDCPYCHKLEGDLKNMTDVTIYTFLMPITALHPQAEEKAVQLWCQPNRTAAWTAWMREQKAPPQVAVCDNPVKDTISLGESFGFTGTPTIVFPDGSVQQGYSPKEALEKTLTAAQKAS